MIVEQFEHHGVTYTFSPPIDTGDREVTTLAEVVAFGTAGDKIRQIAGHPNAGELTEETINALARIAQITLGTGDGDGTTFTRLRILLKDLHAVGIVNP